MSRFSPPYFKLPEEDTSSSKLSKSEIIDMNGYIDFSKPVNPLYMPIGISYDGVAATSNRNILAVSLENKVGLMTTTGVIILEPKYNISDLKVWGNIIELYDSGGYQVIKYTFNKELTSLNKKILLVSKMANGNTAWETKYVGKRVDVHYTNTMPRIIGVTKNIIILQENRDVALVSIISKSGPVISFNKYLRVIEVRFKNELLGVKPIHFENTLICREIDILDSVGRIKQKDVKWDRSYESEYHISESGLYSRGIKGIDKKGSIMT